MGKNPPEGRNTALNKDTGESSREKLRK